MRVTATSVTAFDKLTEILTGDAYDFKPIKQSYLYLLYGFDLNQSQYLNVSAVSQDLRFDLPTIGSRTIEGAAAAGLAGIAIVAGNTIVVEPQMVIETADAASLFVIGLPA